MRRLLRRLPKSGVKFIVYGLVCVALLVLLATRIGSLSFFSHRTAYAALMSDASGLQPGDQVKVAGVGVGQVDSITTRRGLAVVHFSVRKDLRIPAATLVGVRWRDVLGQKYLYLYPQGGAPYLQAGATIEPGREVPSADIGAFLNALGPVLQAIDPAEANAFVQGVVGGLQGNEAQVSALIDNAATVSSTVGRLDTQIGSVIDNLSTVLGAIGSRSSDLQQVISNLSTVAGALASRDDTLNSVVTNFGTVSGEFAHLVQSNRGSLDTIISSLQTVADTLARHRQELDADLSTLSSGLQPYRLISSFGQWFNVATVYQCLAGQQKCNYQEPGPAPGGASSSPVPGGAGGAGTAPATGGATPAPSPGGSTGAGSGLSGWLRTMAGGS